jgi:hypothetical protein
LQSATSKSKSPTRRTNIRNLQTQANQIQQELNRDVQQLRAVIEGFATAAGAKLEEISFDLDSLVYKELEKPATPPAPEATPAPAQAEAAPAA